MALFTARQARPRTATLSCLKSKDRQMYMYLYILGVALLLFISVSLLQLGLTRAPPDFPVHYDPRHTRKGVSGDLRLHHRHKAGENPSRRRRPPVMNSGNRSKDWKVEKKKKRKGAEVEETRTQQVRDSSDIVDAEEQGENSRIYQRQQLDDMDQFDQREEAKEKEDVFQHQGQQLDDMDQFDREEGKEKEDLFKHQGQVLDKLDHANKHTFRDDSVPKFVEDLSRSRKFQPSRPESRDGEKIDDPVVKIQAPEAKKGSVMAAIEQEMAKRTGRDSLRRSLGETNVKEGSSSGMAPPREFLDDGNKSSLHTDENPVKGEDAGDAGKLPLWGDVQTTVKDVVVDSLHVEANGEQSSGSGLEIINHDSMNALITSMNASALVNEDSKAQESAYDDVVQTEKQVIKDENEDEKRLEAEKNSKNLGGEEGSVVEGDGVKEQVELKKTGSAVKEGRGKNAKDEEEEDEDDDNKIQWGFYPTLSSTLKFSMFIASFFKQENCSLRIFMAWTTAPWAYTPRHQRAIESILYFHPQACIVVFTETIDFQFFDSWVKEGYKIAVARPNLEELLEQTPAIDFAYVWYEWRNMNLFYIHYTELLRIAALHKYGGVWLDMDMILARPLPKLHNVLGSTVAEDGEWVLNGAFMSFDRSSSFLKACIEEFVATYDERLLGWNGADLLNRVASNATRKGGKVWLEHSEHLQVLEPIAFFPLSRHNIIKYFSAAKRKHERVEQKKMLSAILDKSHGTHLWNSVTGRLVPEVGSLVEQLLNRFCTRCTDIL